MNISIVTGLGPRTGTSFVMQQAKLAGLPINGERFIDGVTVPKHNPDGYWETLVVPAHLNTTVIKLWYPLLQTIQPHQVGAVVVLERKDKLKQLQSMYKVFRDECKLNRSFVYLPDPSLLLLDAIQQTEEWLQTQTKVLRVYTEDLTDRKDEVIQFLKKGLQWQ
jgi:hypothetical protein